MITIQNDVKKYSESDIDAIYQEAFESAKKASEKEFNKYGTDMVGACGFAWVNVRIRSNTKVGKYLQKYGFSKAYGVTGLQLWNPSQYGGQNIDIKVMGALRFAEVLRKYNFEAYAGSRLD